MKLPRTLKIRDRKLGKEKALGQAIAPDLIEIDPTKNNSRERLDTVCHEALHLLLPDEPEVRIIALANRMSDLLWRDRWRRIEF
jgi:hypothetical protein